RDLAKFLQDEQRRADFQQQVHSYTDVCFEKCVKGVKAKGLDKSEEACVANCVERFLDLSAVIQTRLQEPK
ncbi:Tim10/DDP family zinc finger protein, partial [Hyaloraphidium curvatum]